MLRLDSLGQTQLAHDPDAVVVEIELVPDEAMTGRNGVRVVIVVPAFAAGKESDPPVVPRVIARSKAPGSPHMGRRVNQPGGMKAQRHSQEDTP